MRPLTFLLLAFVFSWLNFVHPTAARARTFLLGCGERRDITLAVPKSARFEVTNLGPCSLRIVAMDPNGLPVIDLFLEPLEAAFRDFTPSLIQSAAITAGTEATGTTMFDASPRRSFTIHSGPFDCDGDERTPYERPVPANVEIIVTNLPDHNNETHCEIFVSTDPPLAFDPAFNSVGLSPGEFAFFEGPVKKLNVRCGTLSDDDKCHYNLKVNPQENLDEKEARREVCSGGGQYLYSAVGDARRNVSFTITNLPAEPGEMHCPIEVTKATNTETDTDTLDPGDPPKQFVGPLKSLKVDCQVHDGHCHWKVRRRHP